MCVYFPFMAVKTFIYIYRERHYKFEKTHTIAHK